LPFNVIRYEYVFITITIITINSNITTNAIAHEAPYLAFNFNHCILAQYTLGSIIEFN